MDDNLVRREAARPRRVSAAAELEANVSLQDGEVIEVHPARETQPGPGRLSAAGGRMERRKSAPQGLYQRYMPMEPLKFPIPRKTKEKRALFQYVSTESREYEDMMAILTSGYIDTGSAGCFTYCKPRLVHSEVLEKEFVEKRREMKADGRTDKELEESYCFLLADTVKLSCVSEKGLFVGQSWLTVLGNPSKGVYLSRYSDLLQINSITPGATGEILIFKVMKGKVKSIYENMKNLLDPTPRFDSHISKNASKVTSLNSYRAFELTQQYFYEYSFDELRQRPRQVCPYAVVSFQFKGKDSPLPIKPLAPIRLNSQSAEGSKEHAQFTVWTGDLVKGDQVLFQICLRSFSPPFLPHRLQEKLEIGWLMRLDQVTKLLPSDLLSYNLYNSSQEVVKNGHCCSLLEVTDRSRSTTSVTRLLQELEIKRVVLVTPLTDRGFLFLLSSVQMATPTERGESWKRCLQALFVFPESRDAAISVRYASSSHDASQSLMSGGTVMPRLNQFIPALHHALVKARANPPPELSAGVERQAREYLIGQNEGKVRQYPMGEYESKLDEQGKLFPAPNHHRVNMDGYLRSYMYSPALYLLSVARARQMVEAHCGPEEPEEVRLAKSCGDQREATGKGATGNTRDGQTNTQKMQQLINLVLTCKRNAENEVKREEGEGVKAPGRKRRLEQETAERTLKFLKASQEPGRHSKIPVEGNQVPASPGSLASVIGSVGLKDVDLREDGSELAARLLRLLTGINKAARGTANQSLCEVQEEGQRESCPFDSLATKLGLPTNCDIDLRKQEELEEQTAGSISSLEGFSPSSHSGEMNHHGAAGRGEGLGRRAGGFEEDEEEGEVPWVLIPITGLCSERYTQRDRNIPQDPRFQHLTTATSITTTTKPPRKSPTSSPEPSLPPSPFQCPSPEPSPPPSPSQCPSPDPSPPPSPSQCPSPEPSPPPSPSQCPSPEPSPPPSPSQCPSPQPSPTPSHSLCPFHQLSHPLSPSWCQSPEPNELSPFNKDHSGANEEQLAPTASMEFAGMSKDREAKPQWKEKKNEEPSISVSIQPSIPPASERRTNPSPPATEREKEDDEGKTGEVKEVEAEPLEEEKETQPVERVQKRGEEEADEGNQDEDMVDMKHVVASDKEQKGEVKELVGSSFFSPSVSSPPSRPLRDIDKIVDKHVGDFSSEIQLLLQEESIHYNFPQSPHSTSNTEFTALQHTLPHPPISQPISKFSQYVSFYNPCPPVQDYVNSLQDSIDSMLTEFDDRWPSHKPVTNRTNADAALASRVSAFVSSIRAANAKTGRDDDGLCGELTAADAGASVSQTPALFRGSEVWQPNTITKQFPDATNNRNPPTSNVTLSVTTSASGSVNKPTSTAVLHPSPNKSPQSHWKPQQSHTLEVDRTVTHNIRQTQDNTTSGTIHCITRVEGGSSTNYEVTLPGFSGVSEPVSSPASVSVPRPGTGPAPPATALSSLISQLQPEVFNSLVEIIKDVKRNSLQFYLHSTEPEDQVYEDVKEHLMKQGNVEQSPVAFLNQENSDNRLLVIIKNKDIAGHVHKIPGLMSLKRHPSVVFVGIDTLDDIRNNSYNELFVSGGCIVSDELVLNPDFITHDRLAALLMFLEQHSSPDSVWRWKVHCKTHKKLKEQARFRRDAANLLDVLSAYQKRQIVEFLPYHHCDMNNHQSPDLDCLKELQARYTQYRHTVFLTDHNFEKFPAYSSGGIIVASIEGILHDFTRLVGYHDIKDKQPILDDMLAPKRLGRQLSHSDSVLGSEPSPSIFPEHIHPLSSSDQPQHLLQQSVSSLPPLSHLSDQLVPDASCKEGVPHHSGTDFEVLRFAISQLRAERQAQQLQQQQAELSINPIKGFLPNPICTGSRHTTPLLGQGGPSESVQLTPGKKAVAATLELIHSALQLELGEEERREDGAETPTEGQRKGGSRGGGEPGDQRDGTPVRVENWGPSNSDTSTPSSNQNTAAVTGPSNQIDSASDGRGKAAQQGEPAFLKAAKHGAAKHGAASSSATACPVEGDRSRDTQSGQQQPIRGEGAPPGNSTVGTASGTKVTGSITMVTDQEDNLNPALPRLQQIQQPQHHLQQLNNQQQQLNERQQLQQGPSHLQQPPHSQQQRGAGLLQPPHLPRLPNQPFSRGPLLGPLTALGGGLLGPTPVWPGGLGPAGAAAALVWGFQQAGRDFTGHRLLGGLHNPAGQGSNRYRGGQRGGGFNGM
ncbi:protein TASOR isoform X2 [Siniperca chuatsi]|uniref:protein TASOR isoform X2 n=1 Tax=Siniperca chuatsi TaxID=119488 RepID=UPI001CE06D7A|nr:protein TASOR isoform X2 [Siniperca chuatsi]